MATSACLEVDKNRVSSHTGGKNSSVSLLFETLQFSFPDPCALPHIFWKKKKRMDFSHCRDKHRDTLLVDMDSHRRREFCIILSLPLDLDNDGTCKSCVIESLKLF